MKHQRKSGSAKGALAKAIRRYAADPRLTVKLGSQRYAQQVIALAKLDGMWTQMGGI